MIARILLMLFISAIMSFAQTKDTIYCQPGVITIEDTSEVTMSVSLVITRPAKCTVVIQTSQEGTTIPTAGTYTYKKGTSVTFTAIPNTNYEFSYWTINGEVISTNPVIRTMHSNLTIIPYFKLAPPPIVVYVVNIQSSPNGTTIPTAGTYNYNEGTSTTVTAVPSTGYQFDHWTVNGTNVTTNPLPLTITSNLTIVPFFVLIPPPPIIVYTVILQQGANGTTTPAAGTYNYNEGTSVTFTAIPNVGYQFDHWTVNGVSNTTNPLVTSVTSDLTIVPYFTAITYSVVVQSSPNGTTTPAAGTYTYNSGTSVTFTATPNTGYQFDHWTINGVSNTANPVVSTITSNLAIVPYFTALPPVTYTVTLQSGANGTTVPVAGTYTYNSGTSVTFTATANTGYRFDHWTVNGTNVTTNPLVRTITSNLTIVPYFVSNTTIQPIRYFSSNGNNSDGKTWATAWNNTNSIVWSQLAGGGYLLFDGGQDSIVYNISIQPTASGSWGKPIYIMPARYYYGSGVVKTGHSGKVIINHNLTGGRSMLAVLGYKWIYFKGFIGRNIGWRALYIDGEVGGTAHITFDSCEVWGVANDDCVDIMGKQNVGANLPDTNVTPHHIEIKYCKLVTQDNKTSGGQEEDVIYIHCAGDIWIHHSILWQRDNHNCSSGDCPHVDNIQVAQAGYGLKIYNNIMIRDSCVSGANMILGIMSRVSNYHDTTLVYNNYFYSGGMYGCGSNWTQQILWRAPEFNSSYRPMVYSINNTFVASNDVTPNSAAEGGYNPLESNNIFVQMGVNGNKPATVPSNLAQWYSSYSTGDLKYVDSMHTNLAWQKWDNSASFGGNRWRWGTTTGSIANWSDWISKGGDGVNADPKLVNNYRYYHTQPYVISSTSPAVGKGTDMRYIIIKKFGYLPDIEWADIRGKVRGAQPTLGCYEP